jgi:hypothetical protein
MTPIGTAPSAASPVTISDPTIALAIPPPVSPTGVGMRVKNAQFSEATPCLIT